MGAREKRKGNRVEREITAALKALGCDAIRIPVSGAAGPHRCDIIIRSLPTHPLTNPLHVEVKARRNGWQSLYQILQNAHIAILKADRQPPIVAMTLDTLETLLCHKQPD